jgi:hypothetical protein
LTTPSSLNSPSNERAPLAFDASDKTKYLNFDGVGSGLIMALSGPEVVRALELTARTNDNIPEWDPTQFTLFASNEALTWEDEGWSKVANGQTGLNGQRGDVRTVSFVNEQAYRYYKLVFNEVRGNKDGKRFVHVSEVALLAPDLRLVQDAQGLTLSGSQAAIASFIAAEGNLQFLPGVAGGKGTMTVVANDGLNITRRAVVLEPVDPFAMSATYNGGNFEVFAANANGLRVNRAALDTVQMGVLSDHLQVLKLSDRAFTVQATQGADTVSVFLGNTRGNLERTVHLQGTEHLADDTLVVQFKPLASSTTENVIRLGSGELVSGIERITWDETLSELQLVGDTVKIVAVDPADPADPDADPVIDLGRHTVLRVKAERLVVVGDLYAKDFHLHVAPRNLSVDGGLYRYGVNGEVDDSYLPPGAVQALPPLQTGEVDLSDLMDSPYAALIQPADPTASISLGGQGGGVTIDPAQLSQLNNAGLVLGARGASNPVSIDGSGGPIVVNVPLVIQSTGESGKVQLSGELQGVSLEIFGPGNTTEFRDGTVVGMREGLLIEDAVRFAGNVVLEAGAPGQSADLRITGRINGGLGDADVLNLSAQGGTVQVQGRVGDGIGSTSLVSGGQGYVDGIYDKVFLTGGSGTGATARITVTGGAVTEVALVSVGGGYRAGEVLSANRSSLGDFNSVASGFAMRIEALADLEGLNIRGSLDVSFDERVYVDGDIVIDASGTVTFSDQVVLRGGGQLIVHNAAKVFFLGGITTDGAQALQVIAGETGSSVAFSGGILPGAEDQVSFDGVKTFSLWMPAAGSALASATVVGGDLHIGDIKGRTQLRLALDVLDIQADQLTMSKATANLSLMASAQDLRVHVAEDVGSLDAPVTGSFARLSVSAGESAQALGDVHLKTSSDSALVRQGVVTDGQIQWQADADLLVSSGTQVASTGAGSIRLNVAGDLRMDADSVIRTVSGQMQLSTQGFMEVNRLQSQTGRIALDAGENIRVVGSHQSPQITTAGDLDVRSSLGVAAYGFDRLFVDVHEITGLNRVTGDVVISGWNGLQIGADGYHSDSADGWLVLMSGRAGLVEANGAVTAYGDRVARISGKTVIMPAVLPGRQMQGFNAYITEPIEVSPTAHALDELNRYLRQDWLDAVGLGSSIDQRADALRAQAGQTSRLAILKAQGLVATAYDELGSALHTTALLEAALHRAQAPMAASAWQADALNAWAERSFEQRERDALLQDAQSERDFPVRVSDSTKSLTGEAVASDAPVANKTPVTRLKPVFEAGESSRSEQATDDADGKSELVALEQSLMAISQQERVDF